MSEPVDESVFDLLPVVATVIVFATSSLGIPLDPALGITVVVPRFITQLAGVADELSLLVGGVVLPFTISLLHTAAFTRSIPRTALNRGG